MATMPPFLLSGTASGENVNIEVHKLGQWMQIGTGTITTLDSYDLDLTGSYKIFGNSGNIDIGITLTDHNPDAQSGTCSVTYNGQTDSAASYKVNSQKLLVSATIGGSNEQVSIWNDGNRNRLDLSGSATYELALVKA